MPKINVKSPPHSKPQILFSGYAQHITQERKYTLKILAPQIKSKHAEIVGAAIRSKLPFRNCLVVVVPV